MAFLRKEDFELFEKYGGAYSGDYPEAHQMLKALYDKLGVITESMRNLGFETHIRRNPQNQGQRYEFYHWAQLCPIQCPNTIDKIYFVIDFTKAGYQMHIDCSQRHGYYINDESEQYQNWSLIPVDEVCGMSKEEIIQRTLKYCKENFHTFLLFGKIYNIDSCINYLNMEKYTSILQSNKNIILSGAPGTGKTFLAKEIARAIGASNENIVFVQFHPSYDYTDFIEGLRPVKTSSSEVGFERKDGIFLSFCRKALTAYKKAVNKVEAPKFVFIIDEINRGDISKIFGELFFAIDPGYRGSSGCVATQYANLWSDADCFDEDLSGDEHYKFYVPENVYIIGTMNDIDRSVESMDFAFRRRFAFMEILAKDNVGMLDSLEDEELKNLAINKMNSINTAIESTSGLSRAYHIGASYFLKLANYNGTYEEKFVYLWSNHIEVLIKEYLRGNPDIEKEVNRIYQEYLM